MQQGDLISAIATAVGESGIGIIRLSGAGAIDIAGKCFVPFCKKNIAEYGDRKAIYGKVVDEAGNLVDEAICIVMKAPHSYTCEDVVELQCHGGNIALREVLSLTYRLGARAAERGEFTKRAFLNGRLDLTQAQAVMDVIQAPTKASLQMATGHLSGKFSSKIKDMRNDILAMIAHLEASIDFPEDDIEDLAIEEARSKINGLLEKVNIILSSAHTGKILREGIKTAIIGKPNAGKSSIMNMLLKEQRAIVTDIAGTTRDSIEESVNIAGVPLVLVDTAGIHDTEDVVEKIGVERAKECIDRAELILAVFDSSSKITDEDYKISRLVQKQRVLVLLNKSDLPSVVDEAEINRLFQGVEGQEGAFSDNKDISIVQVSATTGEGLDLLEKAIVDFTYAGNIEKSSDGFLNDARQTELLRQAKEYLNNAEQSVLNGMGEDFIVIDLRLAWEKLGEITGETVSEDIIDEIFSRFCIGK